MCLSNEFNIQKYIPLERKRKGKKKWKKRGVFSVDVFLWHQHSPSFHWSMALCKPSKETFDKSLWNSKEYFLVLSPDDLHRKLTFKRSFLLWIHRCQIHFNAKYQLQPNNSCLWVWIYWGFDPQKKLQLKVKQHFANPHWIQTLKKSLEFSQQKYFQSYFRYKHDLLDNSD